MMKIIMCVPNISEGKDLKVVEQVVGEIRKVVGVKIQDVSSDPDHNRSVLTYLGEPEAVLKATQAMAKKAFELIDMTQHHGSHPRMGAVDVVPFIPIRGVETKEAVEIARRFAKFVGEQGVPVYYYEDAATRPERKSLTDIRKGEYEALPEKLKSPAWAPDEGPAVFNPKSGGLVTGARFPLVAFNVNLRTENLEIAQKIAKAVRQINGGYRFVRAIGLSLEDQKMVQVSMNLTHYRKTPIPRVFETLRSEAARYGVKVAANELVGPVPLGALEEVLKHYLQVHDFSMDQIIENALIE
ncbi:MAG: glutamate formimidoyltransferase [Deltaproteobacteria bacterium]|nr:MAG: glutamate formimidoyltransferase [Deltaproteobacteria bacterium]